MNSARAGEFRDRVSDFVDDAVETASQRLAEIKPKLRGWPHAGSVPLILAASIVLYVLAPSGAPRIGAAVFGVSSLLLFSVSAVYNCGTWRGRAHAVLKRWDHANIFVLIAGSYTPFTLLLLHGHTRTTLLSLVWGGALAGVFFRIFWTHAPRWLYVPIYIAMGWAAIFFIPAFFHGATALGVGIGVAVFTLICVGGALYTLGGVVYGFRRPNPWPQWFGFHEVFHVFTILAFAAHYTGVSLATYAVR
ncbi:PAQR family membrane homeostasis protein TrhA [Nocardioides sp. Kera G14]|uniref:PAQR family membrane homeostasis protein TrhA n=1 Tax=Nocardioides sp. Kera G14 TaxID=2884264 RepID=UPI001D0F790A|nr:hemolysin III family protein [Nocardioides sp. Kera G14]UDY22918.1 hemolysin III family protein [Nocardioides sp. Kera G14]